MDYNIGNRVLQKRISFGWTLQELSDKTDLDVSQISKIEGGQAGKLQAKTIYKLAKALDTTTDWLLGIDDEN
ncbi:MAG: helix-turn-helix domain-containing protein [Promethearchaeota archaeon]